LGVLAPVVARADDSAVAGITVFPGRLYPAFSRDVDEYEVELPLSAAAYSLSVASESPYAQVAIDGVVMRLTTVPRAEIARVEVVGPSGNTSFVTLKPRPSQQTAYVKASNPSVADDFGTSVAMSADASVLAVGAPGEDGGNEGAKTRVDGGAVYVYRRGPADAWVFDDYVKSRMPAHGFGAAVALSRDGSTLVVGEPDEDSGVRSSGAVEVFARHGRYRHERFIKSPSRTFGGSFGASVAVNGSVVAVGAPGEDAAYVLRDGSVERIAAPSNGERFGEVVSLGAEGNTVSVSSVRETRVYSETRGGLIEVAHLIGRGGVVSGNGDVVVASDGQMLRVVRNSDKGWFSAGAIKAPGEHLALDFDGAALVVGNVVDVHTYQGGARIFRFDGKAWLSGEPLTAANAAANDLAGVSVAIDALGTTVVMGAPGEDGAGPELSGDPASNALESAGAAYVFR
jgi:hypothetical protein